MALIPGRSIRRWDLYRICRRFPNYWR